MRARWYLLVLGSLLAAGGVVLFVVLREATNAVPASATNRRESRSTAPSPASPAGASTLEASQSLTAERTDALAIRWNDASHDVVGPVFEGALVVVDHDGVKHDAEDGAFVPDFIDGDDCELEEGERRHVAVKHGRFRFDARRGTVMVVNQLVLAGRPAKVERGVEFASGEPLVIAARFIDDALLHVVDATTHAELADVTVARDESQGLVGHPGNLHAADVALAHAQSPFHVTRESTFENVLLGGSIWIGASDHVWQSVTIDFGHELERMVELAPAGSLVVTVTEPADPSVNEVEGLPSLRDRAPHLRLRSVASNQEGVVIADVPALPTDLAFDGIAPGELTASIEVGDPFPSPFVVSRTAVTVAAGATAHATLCLDLSNAPPPTTLAGTLHMPPAWGDTRMTIDCVPLLTRKDPRVELLSRADLSRLAGLRFGAGRPAYAELDPIRNRPGWYVWSVSPIQPATYLLRVERAGFGTQLEVGPDGRDDVLVSLPEPALLHVRVVDAATKEEVKVSQLSWHPADVTSAFAMGMERDDLFHDRETILSWDPAAKCCVGAVRSGGGWITGYGIGATNAESSDAGNEFTVVTGSNELVVRGHRPCGVDLEFAQTGERPAQIFVGWQRVDAAASESRIVSGSRSFRDDNSVARILLPGPGRYRLTPRIRGEEVASATFEVDVADGEFVKRTVTLRKE